MDFKKFRIFDTEIQLDEFFRTEYPLAKTYKSHKQGCSECSKRKSGHQMRMKRIKCDCKLDNCHLEFKIHKCDERHKYVVYVKGYDIHAHKKMIKGKIYLVMLKRCNK